MARSNLTVVSGRVPRGVVDSLVGTQLLFNALDGGALLYYSEIYGWVLRENSCHPNYLALSTHMVQSAAAVMAVYAEDGDE